MADELLNKSYAYLPVWDISTDSENNLGFVRKKVESMSEKEKAFVAATTGLDRRNKEHAEILRKELVKLMKPLKKFWIRLMRIKVMKVIYKTSMVNKIIEEIYKAEMNGKEIDRFILTPDEWEDLYKELKLLCIHTVPYSITEPYKLGEAIAKIKGIPIFVNEWG